MAISLCFYLHTSAQPKLPEVDSLRIESLKIKLPSLKGTALVDCLNDISWEFSYHLNTDEHKHLAYYYTKEAYREALKINYKYGLAFSLMNIGFFMRRSAQAQSYIQQAISIGESLHNDKILGWAYQRMSYQYYNDNIKKIALWKKALLYFEKCDDTEGQGDIALLLGQEYLERANYKEAFPYIEKAIVASKKKRTHVISWMDGLMQQSILAESGLYEGAGDYKTAMSLLVEAQKYGTAKKLGWNLNEAIGRLFNNIGVQDSAFHYLRTNLEVQPNSFYAKMRLGEYYLKSKQFDKALSLFKECESSLNKRFTDPDLLMNLGRTYAEKGNYSAALPYTIKGLPMIKGIKQIMDGNELLSRIYFGLGLHDSSYFYLKRYTTLKDSVSNPQFLWELNTRVNNYKRAAEDQQKLTALALLKNDNLLKDQLLKEQVLLKEKNETALELMDKDNKLKQQQLDQEVFLKDQKEAKISLLDKDNKIKQQQLRQEALTKNILFGGIVVFLLIGIGVFRNLSLQRKNEKLGRERTENELMIQKLESDKLHTEMQQQATELEMQALRAQMSPHFIFNCLSSINKYIIKNESEAASDYLTRFSRLIRLVLINSQKPLITLEDELDMLRLYLDMERLRFNNAFDYNITFVNTIEPATVFIPPLLLQPFCENAIWHGLMHKDGHGKLDIALHIEDGILYCSISDNGIGRLKAGELKSKSAEQQKSLGLKITNNRLAILNQGNKEESYYTMNDIVVDGEISGTRVDINIKYKDLVTN